jgi:hypothetical protein
LSPADVLGRLAALTGKGAEQRAGQRAYAEAAIGAFLPRAARDQPRLMLAEAGTGIGKTLGYLAPASLWSEKAGGPVWISTYTKALQRQLTAETARIYGSEAAARGRVVIRKGRENYLCLLNLEDALQGGFAGRAAILAHLVARWAGYSRDGDMVGGDLPGWLPTLFRRNGSTALTDRRGECVYAGCPHYRKCFIEHAARASAQADLVVANHALVMVNAARGREEVIDGIRLERERLAPLRALATVVVDTSSMRVHDLRRRISSMIRAEGGSPVDMQVRVLSFGFKHGGPSLVFDVRFLDNPYFVDELRALTGVDERVRAYVLKDPAASTFLDKTFDLLTFLLPKYEAEGKSYLTIALGCTGGQHRSVTTAIVLGERLAKLGYPLRIAHRDAHPAPPAPTKAADG